MTHLILSRAQIGGTAALGRNRSQVRVEPVFQTPAVHWVIRYLFYAFIFVLPFEEAYIPGGTSVPKLLGLALAAVALLQRHVCYRFPPKALWWFLVYFLVFATWSAYLVLFPPQVPDSSIAIIRQFVRLAQLLALFWLSYNLMKEERVINGMLWVLGGSTILLAVLQLLGITSEVSSDPSRATAFEGNPNSLATVLSLGLIALFGLSYGREKHDWKGRALFWLGSGVLATAMVQTGSRGSLVALVGALSFFFLRGKSLTTKLKFGSIALIGIILLGVSSYRIEAVRVRWERTFYDQSLAGRERIYPEAIGMILERPLIGWGPVNHFWELGPRLGEPYRDEHNVYLWILAEVGVLGAIPFFAGLWLCWRAAWIARHGLQGVLPLAMLFFLLTASMNSTLHRNKYFWVVLSLALASNTYAAVHRISNAVPRDRRSRFRWNSRPRVVRVARSSPRF